MKSECNLEACRRLSLDAERGGLRMRITTLGFPRIGQRRELKNALEQYWEGKLPDSGTDGRRRAKTAKQADRETGKTAMSTWKCPTRRACKVFRRRHPHRRACGSASVPSIERSHLDPRATMFPVVRASRPVPRATVMSGSIGFGGRPALRPIAVCLMRVNCDGTSRPMMMRLFQGDRHEKRNRPRNGR